MHALIMRTLTITGVFLIFTPAYAQVSAVTAPLPGPATWTIVAVGLVGTALAARCNRRK